MDDLLLLLGARPRVVAHGDNALVKDRLEHGRNDLMGVRGLTLGSGGLGGHDPGQSIDELLHLGRQGRLELGERALDVRQDMRAGEALDERATEVQRAELRERQTTPRQGPKRLALDTPELRSVAGMVVDGKAGFLQRGKIATDGSCD